MQTPALGVLDVFRSMLKSANLRSDYPDGSSNQTRGAVEEDMVRGRRDPIWNVPGCRECGVQRITASARSPGPMDSKSQGKSGKRLQTVDGGSRQSSRNKSAAGKELDRSEVRLGNDMAGEASGGGTWPS